MTKLPGFFDAVKRPFQNLKNLVIGVILMMIPIVNFVVTGYFIQCAKTALRRNYRLPQWTGWGSLFVKGIAAIVITFIYLIPVIIVGLIAAWATMFSLFSSMALTGSFTTETLLATISAGGIGLVVTGVVFIIFALLSMAAIIRYAEKEKFGAAFEVGAIASKAFTGTFFGMWILAIIYSIIVSIIVFLIFSFIPYIGSYVGGALASFIVGVTTWTILAEAYARR